MSGERQRDNLCKAKWYRMQPDHVPTLLMCPLVKCSTTANIYQLSLTSDTGELPLNELPPQIMTRTQTGTPILPLARLA